MNSVSMSLLHKHPGSCSERELNYLQIGKALCSLCYAFRPLKILAHAGASQPQKWQHLNVFSRVYCSIACKAYMPAAPSTDVLILHATGWHARQGKSNYNCCIMELPGGSFGTELSKETFKSWNSGLYFLSDLPMKITPKFYILTNMGCLRKLSSNYYCIGSHIPPSSG